MVTDLEGIVMRTPVLKKTMCLTVALILCSILTACGAAGASDEILLIDEMAQIDFDIDYPVGQITKGVTVKQDFVSNADVISQIWLYGATYMRDNTATVNVSLYKMGDGASDDADGEGSGSGSSASSSAYGDLIDSWVIDSSKMDDNSIIKLEVDPDGTVNHDLKGTSCIIVIESPDGEPDLSPTFWMTEEDVYPDGHLTIGDYAQYNDLWFQVVGRDK